MGRRRKYTPAQLKEKRKDYSKKSYLKHKKKVDERAKERYHKNK